MKFYEISKLYNNTIGMGDVTVRNQLLFCVDLKCIILKKKRLDLTSLPIYISDISGLSYISTN